MNVQTQVHADSPARTEHFDVLIAGAGISGVGAAYHLTMGHHLNDKGCDEAVAEQGDFFGFGIHRLFSS